MLYLEKLREQVRQIVQRANAVRGKGEEATKQALVLPLLAALGYDVWNPEEVLPEYVADFVQKKAGPKEKVDYALLFDGAPRIFIEAKALDVPLDGHDGQLARYFNSTPNVSLGVLTDGLEWRFFTDTASPNVQDSVPFFQLRLDRDLENDANLEMLLRLHRARFIAADVRDMAVELTYSGAFEQVLREQIDLHERAPSDVLMRWLFDLSPTKPGRITAATLDRFRPIVRQALGRVLGDIVRRAVSAMGDGVQVPTLAMAAAVSEVPVDGEDEPKNGVVVLRDGDVETTARELHLFELCKKLFGQITGDVGRLSYKDTTGYFSVLVDKTWAIRFVVESTNKPYVMFPQTPEQVQALMPAVTARPVKYNTHTHSAVALRPYPQLTASFRELEPLVLRALTDAMQPRTKE